MKPISINGFLQITCVLLGFFALRLLVRPSIVDTTPWMHFNAFSVFLSRNGLLLLFFPLIWVFYAAVSTHLERSVFSSGLAHLFGIAFSVVTVLSFLYAVVFFQR
jgi:hypothetical protein